MKQYLEYVRDTRSVKRMRKAHAARTTALRQAQGSRSRRSPLAYRIRQVGHIERLPHPEGDEHL
ncbi:MAG: hypothetical protein KME46_18605 [Brasilonema angustatum HA4187-MV1]|jgi:hypothetical protein|nr:hypothetical protein [Brasilonema angustatum HA4187-MV1]